MNINDFRNEDTELVLFYKDKIELDGIKLSHLLVMDIDSFKPSALQQKNTLYPCPNQSKPLLSPVSLTVFQSDYEIMINYFRIVEKGLYSIGYSKITPQQVYQVNTTINGNNELFNAICDSVMQIYGDIIKQKKLDYFFARQPFACTVNPTYIPGYLVDQIILGNTK